MTTSIGRRHFIRNGLYTTAALSLSFGLTACRQKKRPRVIIVGGGFAGATAAQYLAYWAPNVDVLLIERNSQFISCPLSNLVLSGARQLSDLTQDYSQFVLRDNLHRIQADVVAIDTEKKSVQLEDGERLSYERLILAPGIAMDYSQLPMMASEQAQRQIPHAWKAGAQTTLLKKQIDALPIGGVVAMTVPAAPYRCPPGPYERASQIAFHLKHHNPTAKLLILDANPDITSKKSLFVNHWQQAYDTLIEYIPMSGIEDIDVQSKTVETLFDHYRADVLNVIPPQMAGEIAQMAGVVNIDNRWCDVDFLTYESTAVQNVHIIGDAVAAKVPKSGHIANQQAKVCAAAVAALLNDQSPVQQPVFSNTCYSFVDNQQAGHIATVYRYDDTAKEMLPMPGGGVSEKASVIEGQYAASWASNIWRDMLGVK